MGSCRSIQVFKASGKVANINHTKRRRNLFVCVSTPRSQDQSAPSYGGPVISESQMKEWFSGFNMDFDQKSCIKVAIVPRSVGSLLGMGGQRIKTLQELYNVRMYITSAGDCLPGTRSRLMYVYGGMGDCMMTLSDVAMDIFEPVVGEFGEVQPDIKKLGAVFPLDVVGKLFGEGGSILRNIMAVTGATVVAQSMLAILAMQDVRKFDMLGSPEQILQAYVGLLSLSVTEPKYAEFAEMLPTVHTDSQWLPRFVQVIPRNQALMNATYTVEIGIPESLIPKLLGRSATNLIKLLQASGNCQIDIPRDVFVEGTELRKVILKGTFKDVMKAQAGLDKLIRENIRNGFIDPSVFGKPARQYNSDPSVFDRSAKQQENSL